MPTTTQAMPSQPSTRGRPRLSTITANTTKNGINNTAIDNDIDASDAAKLQKRRARLRDAQQAHRARRDASLRQLRERVARLEGVVGGMGAAMAGLGGELVADGVLATRPHVARAYAFAARRTLLLARAAASEDDEAACPATAAAGCAVGDAYDERGDDESQSRPRVQPRPQPRRDDDFFDLQTSAAALVQRLGAAAFPISSALHVTTPSPPTATAPLDPTFYLFPPATRDMLLFLAAGRDSLLARFFFFVCRTLFDAFLAGDPGPCRIFFRFSPLRDSPAVVAERVFATLQLILFGSYDAALHPPFAAAAGPFVDASTVKPGDALGRFAMPVRAPDGAAPEHPEYYAHKPRVLSSLSTAVAADMRSSLASSELMDANELGTYLESKWNIYEKDSGRLRVVLRSPAKRVTQNEGRPESVSTVSNSLAREATIESESLFAGLYTASICAGSGMRMNKRQVDRTAAAIVSSALQAA